MSLVLLAACTDELLDKPAFGSLSDEVLSDETGVNALLIGAYSALDLQDDNAALGGGGPWESNPTNWIYGDIAGGDAHKGSDGGDQAPINAIASYNVDPSNGFFNTKWKALYEGVTRANMVLSMLANLEDISEENRANIAGQARFLRGHYYFELKKMFNMVPWVDETMEDTNVPNDTDIWPNIEADFQLAYDNIPSTQNEIGRANKWAAGAYLGKTYLYQEKFQESQQIFSEVISSGTTAEGQSYDLTPNYHASFNAELENNEETVFAIQMVANDGTNTIANSNQGLMLAYPYQSPFRCCGFLQPTQDLVNSFRTSSAGLPLLDDYNSDPVANDMGILSTEAFTPDTQSLDPRLDWTVGRRGIPYHDWGYHPGYAWVRLQSYGGPYAPKKHIYWQYHADEYSDQSSWAPGNAINYNIIRFADVLLMAAEAEAQLGNLTQALEYVNRVRGRVANNPQHWLYDYVDEENPMGGFSENYAANYNISEYPAGFLTSSEQAMEVIRFERRIELGMEGHRFFDLVRWGVAEQVLNDFVQYEGQITTDVRGAHFSANDRYYPIPQRQIDLSTTSEGPMLTQNPGY